MNGLRVVLTVTPANPELFADISDVPARLRAERVRTLATLGLVALSGGAITRAAITPSAKDERAPHAPDRALAFAKALTNDV